LKVAGFRLAIGLLDLTTKSINKPKFLLFFGLLSSKFAQILSIIEPDKNGSRKRRSESKKKGTQRETGILEL
jgi:hypothetical protein